MKNTDTRRPRLEKNALNVPDFIDVLQPSSSSPPQKSHIRSSVKKPRRKQVMLGLTTTSAEKEKVHDADNDVKNNSRKLSTRSHKKLEQPRKDETKTPASPLSTTRRSVFQQKAAAKKNKEPTDWDGMKVGMLGISPADYPVNHLHKFEQSKRVRIPRRNVMPVIEEQCNTDEESLPQKASPKMVQDDDRQLVKDSKSGTLVDEELGLLGAAPKGAPIQGSNGIACTTTPEQQPGAIAVRGLEYDPNTDETQTLGENSSMPPIDRTGSRTSTPATNDDETHASSRPKLISAFLVQPEVSNREQDLPAAVVLQPSKFSRKCIIMTFSIIMLGLIAVIVAIIFKPDHSPTDDISTNLNVSTNPTTTVLPTTETPSTEPPSTLPPTYGSWNQFGQLLEGDKDGQDGFGSSISLSRSLGDILAIGAPAKELDGTKRSGYVRVFKLMDNNKWEQLGQVLEGTNENQVVGEYGGDSFGTSLSLSSDGSRLAVGAPGSNAGERDGGQVRIFQLNASSIWEPLGKPINNKWDGYSYFGTSVSMSSMGDRLAAGAPGDDSGGYDAEVRVFEKGSHFDFNWVQVGEALSGKEWWDGFGRTLSLSDNGTRLAVGGRASGVSGETGGQVRVYEYMNKEWEMVGFPVTGGSISFGTRSISLSGSGNVLAVGDCNSDNQSIVEVFEMIDNAWKQHGQSLSGCSVSLSSDGERLVIGADNENQVKVYQFKRDSSEWTQVGQLQGETDTSFGGSVSLTSDGNRVAVGAPGKRGRVQVFQLE